MNATSAATSATCDLPPNLRKIRNSAIVATAMMPVPAPRTISNAR